MSLCGRIEVAVETNLPAEKLHDLLSSSLPQLSCITPAKIQAVHLLKEGASKITKEVIDDIDSTKLSITSKEIEGDLMEAYKSFKIIHQATPKGYECLPDPWTDMIIMFFTMDLKNIVSSGVVLLK
ncbi:unnamed protein product [Dovyalis caffra]|uniref:Bet v I/Major latex protein domain-containing protein n=1 Tax=Dovyalis caffra TaxID=77055 RepID=A0AAV1SFT9_9ROSI|nr:unnamed protein product [Dovyalis caffra]